MLKNLKKLSKLSKEFYKRGREVVDIILFGSVVRGKAKPRDIDVCIIFREKINMNLVGEFEKKTGAHVSYLTVDNFFTRKHALVKTLIFEGHSLITGKRLYEYFGMRPFVFYSYKLTGLSPSKKTMFLRSLKDIFSEIKPISLGKATFLVDLKYDEKIKELLDFWNIAYVRKRILETFKTIFQFISLWMS